MSCHVFKQNNGYFQFNNFISSTQQLYNRLKDQSKQKKQDILTKIHDKFSLRFQNKYSDLSHKYNETIQKTNITFNDHKFNIEEEQDLFQELTSQMNQKNISKLAQLIGRMIVKSQKLYQEWMYNEVQNLKEELQIIVIKNYQYEANFTQICFQYQRQIQQFNQEVARTQEVQSYLQQKERQILQLKEINSQLQSQKQLLIVSKHQLDQQIASQKITQVDLTKSVIIKEDSFLQEKRKNQQLLRQKQALIQNIHRNQCQYQKLQEENAHLYKQIQDLEITIQNYRYQLNFYKNRQNSSIIHESYQKLNRYGNLQNYQNTSQKGSFHEFALSHQKSMGKLSIFQNKQRQDRILQKISQSNYSLHSFQIVQHHNLNIKEKDQSFHFNEFNQVTFRPQIDLPQDKSSVIYSQQHIQTPMLNEQNATTSPQSGQIYHFTGKKHNRQRSQSIPEIKSPVAKKLQYNELHDNYKANQNQANQDTVNEQQEQKNHSICSGSDSKVKSVSVSKFFAKKRQHIKQTTQIKNFNYLTRQQSGYLDNKSQKNSVNRVLIKRNIQINNKINDLKQQLVKAQQQIESYQNCISQLQDQIYFYKQQLSKSNQEKIRYKSQIQSYENQLQKFCQVEEKYSEKLQQKDRLLIKTNEQIVKQKSLLESKNQQLEYKQKKCQLVTQELDNKKVQVLELQEKVQQLNRCIQAQQMINQTQKIEYQERINKVKLFCKEFLQQKHFQQIQALKEQYQNKVNELKHNLSEVQEYYKKKLASIDDNQSLKGNLAHTLTKNPQTQQKRLKLQTNFHGLCILNKEKNESYTQDQKNQKALNIFQVLNQQITLKRQSTQTTAVQKIIQQAQKITQRFKIQNQVNQNVYFDYKFNLHYLPACENKQQIKRNSPYNFNISLSYSLIVLNPKMNLKSPQYLKKQLLNTPSTFNSLQPNKQLMVSQWKPTRQNINQPFRTKNYCSNQNYNSKNYNSNKTQNYSSQSFDLQDQNAREQLDQTFSTVMLNKSELIKQIQVFQIMGGSSSSFVSCLQSQSQIQLYNILRNRDNILDEVDKSFKINKINQSSGCFQLQRQQCSLIMSKQDIFVAKNISNEGRNQENRQDKYQKYCQQLKEYKSQTKQQNLKYRQHNQNISLTSDQQIRQFILDYQSKDQIYIVQNKDACLQLQLQKKSQERKETETLPQTKAICSQKTQVVITYVAQTIIRQEKNALNDQKDIGFVSIKQQKLEQEQKKLKNKSEIQNENEIKNNEQNSKNIHYLQQKNKNYLNYLKQSQIQGTQQSMNPLYDLKKQQKSKPLKNQMKKFKTRRNSFFIVSLQSDLNKLPQQQNTQQNSTKVDSKQPLNKLQYKQKTNHQQQQYQQIFQKHLKPYFRRHTLFQIQKDSLPQDQLPDPEKLHIMQVVFKDSSNQQARKHKNLLFYKKFIINLQTFQKLQLIQSAFLQIIQQKNKIIMGNFQIMINTEKQLKISRSNKRCYYVGSIQDGTWKIQKIQQVKIKKPFLKKK